MVLARTLAPEILESIAIGANSDFLKNNTSLCEIVQDFPLEIEYAYKWKGVEQSSDPLNALRDFTKDYIIAGPQFDTQTLMYFRDKVNNFPPFYRDSIKTELDTAFYIASTIANPVVQVFKSNVPIDKDRGFLNTLANALRNCNSPCNYLENVSESIGTMANTAEVNTDLTSPLWDAAMQVFSAPINITTNALNKLSTQIIGDVVELSIAAEGIYRNGVQPFFTPDRKQQEYAALSTGSGIDSQSTSGLLQSDTQTYFDAGENMSAISGDASVQLGDCGRIANHIKRFNYQDQTMNIGMPRQFKYMVNNEGFRDVIDIFGRQYPTVPFEPSYVDLTEGVAPYAYKFDDSPSANYNNGETATRTSNGEVPQKFTEQENALNNGYKKTGNVTYYGYKGDTTPDRNSAMGKGFSENRLDSYSMAVSPDIARSFRIEGIRPGDYVDLTLGTGERVTKRWDDSTAKVYAGRALTGRFDFYTPNGKGSDKPVMGFTKGTQPVGAARTWEHGVPPESQFR